MRILLRLPAAAGVALIRAYQLTLGRLLPQRCRFLPSCSQYAIDAIRARGLARGAAAAGWRLMRCGPWSAGGVDYVEVRREAVRG